MTTYCVEWVIYVIKLESMWLGVYNYYNAIDFLLKCNELSQQSEILFNFLKQER